MHIEYKIKYKIDGDIPINPDWIRAQLQVVVDKLQAKINKKNQKRIRLQALKPSSGWARPIKNQGPSN